MKSVQVDLINTFKTPVHGISFAARSLRWVQWRFRELSGALDSWTEALHYPSTISSLRRLKSLVCATLRNELVKSPLGRFKLESARVWHPRLKSICEQVSKLVSLFGFRRPDPTLTGSLAARSAMYARQAAVAATSQEKLDLSDNAKAWKRWAAKAGDASASAAHSFSKRPVELGVVDSVGAHRTRADVLAEEVQGWSAHWQEDLSTPPLWFGTVPKLPPLIAEDLRVASRSFKRRTCALSGLHPRHVALLSPSALNFLARIFEAAEAIGCMPQQLNDVFIALIPKTDGGN